MKYRVVWQPQALARLADLWLTANDKKAVTAASHKIDLSLANGPLDVGEGRDDPNRVLFEPPLMAWYRVDETSRVVTVVVVRPSRRLY